ncbi:hypothetical protein FA743_19115 [Paracoccus gahaiensis]|uniref:Uncharacterized protein n=1 Tax=Paracoccus gahaiensis TaxID=1706839 RepID=A0A4U0R3G9_9RHOB|nr:hypothetical protein [Paracoccus gahaiensis]TJZ89325.1 hypothetical protein FA743_19115 [Paracoccus gahaiensis]
MNDLKDDKPLTPQERMIQEDEELHEWDLHCLQKEADEKTVKVAQLARIEAKLDEVLDLLRRR